LDVFSLLGSLGALEELSIDSLEIFLTATEQRNGLLRWRSQRWGQDRIFFCFNWSDEKIE
jgi:hypothetical protein